MEGIAFLIIIGLIILLLLGYIIYSMETGKSVLNLDKISTTTTTKVTANTDEENYKEFIDTYKKSIPTSSFKFLPGYDSSSFSGQKVNITSFNINK